MALAHDISDKLMRQPKTWLVTGVAGFIGSHLAERLVKLDQYVVGLDNFSTGSKTNLEALLRNMTIPQRKRFRFVEGDIRDFDTCRNICVGIDIVLHQAAVGSVPRSINDPITTNASNVTGFLNMLTGARDARVPRFVYAASSSTYGDHPALPKIEDRIGKPMSPYAVSKYTNELYSHVFALHYGMQIIGLRYFNVFGPRQDPDGAYAAVIPRWFSALLNDKTVYINGDGSTSRDFCYIDNVIQANLLAAMSENPEALGQVYNVAYGEQTSLTQLFGLIRDAVRQTNSSAVLANPVYKAFRQGDIQHSCADISKANRLLGYAPEYAIRDGIIATAEWYTRLADTAAESSVTG